MPASTPDTLGYARVSTPSQAALGRSLDVQKQDIEDYSHVHKLRLQDVFIDSGVSAYTLDRPALTQLREAMRQPQVTTIVVTYLDRLTRNPSDLGILLNEMDANNVRLLTLHDRYGEHTGMDSHRDRPGLRLVASFGEWQRQRISDATKHSLSALRESGRSFNRDLYGFNVIDGTLVPNRDELTVLQLIKELYEDGLPANAIAKQLNEAGFMGKRGGAWQSRTVRKQLDRLEDPEYADLLLPALEDLS